MERIALDTSVCIELFRRNPSATAFFRRFSSVKVFLPTVALFELLLRTYGLEVVEAFAAQTELLPFDELSARKAAEIVKELDKRGEKIGPKDVLIAATAIAHNCAVATLDLKDFPKVKGLKIVKVA